MRGKRTAKAAPLLAGVCLAVAAAAAPGRNHVPERLDGVRAFRPEAAERNHVALVNVGGAVPEELWRLATTYAVSRLQLNVWTNAIPGSVTERLVRGPGGVAEALGDEHAKVGVFFERRAGGCDVLAAPGAWCVVNVAALEADGPDARTLRDRMAKLVLRAMAHAAGGGATVEPLCSMFYGAGSPEGMDRTNIMLAPSCYFPMLEVLRRVGGDGMASPAYPSPVR